MNLLSDNLEEYIEAHCSTPNQQLNELDRETNMEVLMPQMLSGKVQGRFLSMLSHMIQPKNILEIGTFTGYSALCFAEGLVKDGQIISLDVNEELKERAEKYWEKAGFKDQIKFVLGNAVEVIPTLDIEFDIVFIDADKKNYPTYYELVKPMLRKGGFIMIDNVLWSGKVVAPKPNIDTRAILEVNKIVQEDPEVENVLVPIRDGILIARKL